VLSGRLAVWVDGTEHVAEPGAFLLVPRGVPHAARRVTDEPVRMLAVVSPSGLERFFESVVREGEEEVGRPGRRVRQRDPWGLPELVRNGIEPSPALRPPPPSTSFSAHMTVV
jgi:hypothetical protein